MCLRISMLIVAIALSVPTSATAEDSVGFTWKKHVLDFYRHFDEGRWRPPSSAAKPHDMSLGHCFQRATQKITAVKVRDAGSVWLKSNENAFPNTVISVYDIVDRKNLDRLSTGKCHQYNQPMVHIEVGSTLLVMSGVCRGIGYWRYDVDDFLSMVEAAGPPPKNIWVGHCGGLSQRMTSKEVHMAGKRVSSQWKKREPANRNALKAAATTAEK